MEILRAKTIDLKQTAELTEDRKINSILNENEAREQRKVIDSYPRRLVFELTNACNLNCVMCGRNSADFRPTVFNFEWTSKFEEIIDKVEEVTLMGWGEPTVHPNFKEFLYWAQEKGLRKYFCTNGMKLDSLLETIFETQVDLIGISLDGADAKTNDSIRRGSDFKKIISNIKKITDEKNRRGIGYPYMNFVLTAMKSNLYQIPDLVRLAHDVGVEEVKVVYLTVFDEKLEKESLLDRQKETKQVFEEAVAVAQELGVSLKLPYIQGEDIAEEKNHKDCFTTWRDFFLGSDGYVRPCMSTPVKFFDISKYSNFEEMWNSKEFVNFREQVNKEHMCEACRNCYQSSFANWNKEDAFIQINKKFSPKWIK